MGSASILLAQQLFLAERYETRGTVFCAALLLCFWLLPQKLRTRATGLLSYRHDRVAMLLTGLLAIGGLVYLGYPNFFDHVESTIAGLGLVLHRGEALYPSPDRYPYYGVLYGPALAESQLPLDDLHLPVLLSSKLPGLLAFVISALAAFRLSRTRLSRAYLLFLLPFGIEAFAIRAEPLLLLLVCLTLLLARIKPDRIFTLILAGLMAGVASALKLHGAMYVFAAWLAASIELTLSLPAVLLFTLSAAVAFAGCFTPVNVSFSAFVEYLRLAANHGLSLRLWLENAFYFLFLSAPIAIVWRNNRPSRVISVNLAMILALEILVTVIAAKPGAGTHHLLPFIPVNAYILYKLCPTERVQAASTLKIIWFALAVWAVPVALATAYSMTKDWRHFQLAEAEVIRLQGKYPALVMGVSDKVNYKYSYLRVLLGAGQIDYSAYMDLQLSGVTDNALAAKLRRCDIRYLLLPNGGAAFSMENYYTAKPLFSDDIRALFDAHYIRVDQGSVYSVYSCHDPTQISRSTILHAAGVEEQQRLLAWNHDSVTTSYSSSR